MLSAVPGLLVWGLLVGAWAVHLLMSFPAWWAMAVATVGCGAALMVGGRRATAISEAVHTEITVLREHADSEVQRQRAEDRRTVLDWLQHFHSVVAEGRKALLCALEQMERGEQPSAPGFAPAEEHSDDPFAEFGRVLQQAQCEAFEAVGSWAERLQKASAPEPEQAEVFVFIARRLHALVSRTLAALSAMENGVEDPDLLHNLFVIDHLVTQTRRAVESLAVLGGETPRRVIKPLLLTTVLRQAVAEIEQYPRVRVPLPRQEVALPGHAGPDVIHLLAELVENGTKFSPRTTQVLMRAEHVPAGLAIEVEDRGLHMSPEKLEQLNRLLASPQEVDLRAQFKDGHIGLLVTARLAQRHGIRVELRPNLLGGTQALVVLPNTLLIAPERAVPRVPQPAKAARTAPPTQTPAPASVNASLSPQAPATPADQHGAAATAQVTTSLPQRRRHAAPTPDAAARAAAAPDPAGHEPAAHGRPALPRRSEAHQHIDLPAGDAAPPSSGPASAGLMARYAAGVRRGTPEPAAEAPLPGGPAG